MRDVEREEGRDEGVGLDIDTPLPAKPRTVNVLVVLLVVAVVFSYLGAFAVTNALVAADLIPRWPPGHDPRPRWMLVGFSATVATFTFLGAALRWSNWRQMRRMAAMDDV